MSDNNDNKNAVMAVSEVIGSFISKTPKMTPPSYYIMFLTIYIISFVCIFKKNAEYIGYGLLYAINVFTFIFCVKDIYIKLGDKDMFFIIILIILILNIVSSSLFILSIARIYKFSKEKKQEVLSHQNRKKIHLYRDLFISVVVCMIAVLTYVLITKSKPLFNISIIIENNPKYGLLEKIVETIKMLLIFYSLATSSYLVYHGDNLVKITRSLV
jgi:hypothetical protein